MITTLQPTGRTRLISNVYAQLEEGRIYRVLRNDTDGILIEEMTSYHLDPMPSGNYTINGFSVDFNAAKVFNQKGSEVLISRTLWRLLAIFLANRGRILSHRTLLVNVWGEDYGSEYQYLRVWIHKIRVLFSASMVDREIAFTSVTGIGYRLELEPDTIA